jgi:hypothetical protein
MPGRLSSYSSIYGVAQFMNTDIHTEDDEFCAPGGRLGHLLDRIGFKAGHGRINEFRAYLVAASPDVFSDLKYSTVRGWFQDSSPPMRKIDAIVAALQLQYKFPVGVPSSHIKTWWKVGGAYPFAKNHSRLVMEQSAGDIDDKLQFLIMALVAEESGDTFDSMSAESLVAIKDRVLQFAKGYADPFKLECPLEFLRMIVTCEVDKARSVDE